MLQKLKHLLGNGAAAPAPVPVEVTTPTEQICVLGREMVAEHYLRGEGIEVGALYKPLKVPPSLKVRFVDRMTESDLRTQYPELSGLPLVPVDVVDDGEKLQKFEASSLDFVIANHFIEHSQDPIGTIKNMMRVLKPGGVLYMAVPDKRRSFDRTRAVTTLQHLLDDHENGPAGSRMAHFEEWARHVSLAQEADLEAELKRLLDLDYSIHFHVWDKQALTEFLNSMQDSLGYDLEFDMQNGDEIINVLRKRA